MLFSSKSRICIPNGHHIECGYGRRGRWVAEIDLITCLPLPFSTWCGSGNAAPWRKNKFTATTSGEYFAMNESSSCFGVTVSFAAGVVAGSPVRRDLRQSARSVQLHRDVMISPIARGVAGRVTQHISVSKINDDLVSKI